MKTTVFFGKRLIGIIVTLAVIVSGSYLLMRAAPGNFFDASLFVQNLGNLVLTDPQLAEKIKNAMMARYGMDVPIWQQTLLYTWHSLTFNFGYSFQFPQVAILHTLKSAFPISFMLAVGSTIVSLLIGIPLGIFSALVRGTWLDSAITTLAMAFQALPAYLIAVGMILLFGVVLPGTLPVNGWGQPTDIVLPVIALSLGNIAGNALYMRGALVDTMRQEYIRTAKAKGVSFWSVVLKHGVRNSLVAVLTMLGPGFAFTIVGTGWVETIFGIPGLGTAMGTAFTNLDYPLAVASIFVQCILILVMNLLVDLGYKWLDPRVRLS